MIVTECGGSVVVPTIMLRILYSPPPAGPIIIIRCNIAVDMINIAVDSIEVCHCLV